MSFRFPVDSVLPALLGAWHEQGGAILEAPTGAGKSTRVPLALLEAMEPSQGKILMLEPRRVAARAVASYMAAQRGEAVGGTIGYRTRLDTRVSRDTRLEVVTEGVLIRLLQNDPELAPINTVIFDEFHERSLNADLGLALIHEVRDALRADLRLVIMSATLDCGPLTEMLALPVIRSEGRSYPVAVSYRPPVKDADWRAHCLSLVGQAVDATAGVVLVFVPGAGDIHYLQQALARRHPDLPVHGLHGGLRGEEQQQVLAAVDKGQARVVLATNVAETSLTLAGVTLVLDSGLARQPVYDPGRHRTRLATRRISRASAQQRAGRAGRVAAGACWRLWPESEVIADHSDPEIRQTALDSLVLELARWGCRDPEQFLWLDAPPRQAWNQARLRLHQGGAVDRAGRITALGKRLTRLGIEPALGLLVLAGQDQGLAVTSARLAALLSERDILPRGGADSRSRLTLLEQQPQAHGALQATVRRLLRQGKQRDSTSWHAHLGALLAGVFPGQVARLRPGQTQRYQLADGPGLFLRADDALNGSPWLLVLDTDGRATDATIRLAYPLTEQDVHSAARKHGQWQQRIAWDAPRERVVARRQWCLGALILREEAITNPDSEQVQAGLLDGIRQQGLKGLPWTEELQQWQRRVQCLHRLDPQHWPLVDTSALLASLETWLLPYLAGHKSLRDLQTLPLAQALQDLLTPAQQRTLAQQAPAALTVASGRRVALDYQHDGTVVLAVKLQELFGQNTLPKVAAGRVAITVHLLTPAGRPAAITDDLARFWQEGYDLVRKDLRGRYPKHPWPENPLAAEATGLTKKRLGQRGKN